MTNKKLNRSFARRIGKTLSTSQKEILEDMLPKHLYSRNVIVEAALNNKKIFLEIGFGMGEHFIHQASRAPDGLFIGAEVYLNGVANSLKLASEAGLKNFYIWPDDLDLILNDLPDNVLEGVYILFPDPWPKRKQQKKRILNETRLSTIQKKLKIGGSVFFASDIHDYFLGCKALLEQNKSFKILNSSAEPHDGYTTTKYHQKALYEGREPLFLEARLC